MKEIYSELKEILNTKQKIQVFIIFILSYIAIYVLNTALKLMTLLRHLA